MNLHHQKKILTHPKISLTPHTGASTLEAQDRIGEELAMQVANILKFHNKKLRKFSGFFLLIYDLFLINLLFLLKVLLVVLYRCSWNWFFFLFIVLITFINKKMTKEIIKN